ncbi:ABC transporter ATP-binding protein [Collimonas antrihumi]|uniref:ABC transporter ATP-binding protein n=1 Tax=Collimonas antrihumi TaxID=1940615 RepID=UPI001FEC8D3E|nr:ABC transporter ATP-binding protein [Collimonas antrihumi]
MSAVESPQSPSVGAAAKGTLGTPALDIENLQAWYGESHILHNVNLSVHKGEVVTLLGRNGAGRTTTMRAIMGLTGARKGSIRIGGVETIGLPTHKIAHHGVGYCPEERGIFSSLSTEENLLLPPSLSTTEKGMSVEEIYDMFPNLKERRNSQGTRLSGGEQQMLAVARILRTGARLLLLDEISEGLAPVIVQTLARMITTLKAKGYTIVMVEQNFRFAAPLADRFYVMEHGQIVESFASSQLEEKMPVLNALLGV